MYRRRDVMGMLAVGGAAGCAALVVQTDPFEQEPRETAIETDPDGSTSTTETESGHRTTVGRATVSDTTLVIS